MKGRQLVYFEGQKVTLYSPSKLQLIMLVQDLEQKGLVELDASSLVQDERDKDKKKRLMFSVSTARRVFFIYADAITDMLQWMEAIRNNVTRLANASPTSQTPTVRPPTTHILTPQPAGVGPNAAPRTRFAAAKNSVPYLQEVYIPLPSPPSYPINIPHRRAVKCLSFGRSGWIVYQWLLTFSQA